MDIMTLGATDGLVVTCPFLPSVRDGREGPARPHGGDTREAATFTTS